MYKKPFQNQFYGDDPRWFVGVVETPSNADDLGRVRVRVYGLHSNSTADIDTYDLPLAQVMIPGTEEGTKGLGMNAQLEVGAMVFGVFLDGKASQLPFVLGSFPRLEIADPAVSGYFTIPGSENPYAATGGTTSGEAPIDNVDVAQPAGPGQTFTKDQLKQLAIDAGFSPEEAEIMAKIALAESSGNSNALNDNVSTGDESYGLWQINMLGNLGPSRRQLFGISENSQLYDPATNAAAAFDVYQERKSFAGDGFTAWSVYNSGAYLRY